MDDDQKRAFDVVVSLRDFYGEYGAKKEREAYVTAVLYLGATAAMLARDKAPHQTILVVGLALGTITAVLLVFWQLWNRHFAARMVAACITLTSRWLAKPPSPREYQVTARLFGVGWPSAVVQEYHRARAVPTLVVLVALPGLLLAWGIVAIVALYLS